MYYMKSAILSIQSMSPTIPLHARMYSRVPLLICRYGKHISQEQVSELVSPHPDTLALVKSWLQYNGVPHSSVSATHDGDWLTLTGVPVSKANEILSASYELYRHTKTNETIIRTLGYALPEVLHAHVKTISPTTLFASTKTLRMTPRGHIVRPAVDQAKAASGKPMKVLLSREEEPEVNFVTPDYLRWLYKTFAYRPVSMRSNKIGIAGFINEYPSETDLTKFMTEFRADATDANFTVSKVNGGYDESLPGVEANINIQYASAMAYPTPHTFYSIGGGTEYFTDDGKPAPGDVFLKWYEFLVARKNIPQTISISYGADERDFPPDYATAVCELFAKLGVRGVSILFASGDDGVGAGDCKGKDGKVQFIPLFPASCTYDVSPILSSSTQAQVQVTHQTPMVS